MDESLPLFGETPESERQLPTRQNVWYLLEDGKNCLEGSLPSVRFQGGELPLLIAFKESLDEIVVEIKLGSRTHSHHIYIEQFKGVQQQRTLFPFPLSKKIARNLWIYLISNSFLSISPGEAAKLIQHHECYKQAIWDAELEEERSKEYAEEDELVWNNDRSPPWADMFESGSDDPPDGKEGECPLCSGYGCSECGDGKIPIADDDEMDICGNKFTNS